MLQKMFQEAGPGSLGPSGAGAGGVPCDLSSFFPSLATGSFWVSAVAWCPAEVPAGEHRHPGAMASSVPAPPPPLREQAVSGRCKHPWEAEHVPRRGLRPPEPG